MMMNVAAVAMYTARARKQCPRVVGNGAGLAQGRTPLRTRQAVPAARDEYHHHVIADLEVFDSSPKLFDSAGSFVAEHHRCGSGPVSVDHGEIGMAQTGRSNLHHHFAMPGIVEFKLVDAERLRFVVRRLSAHLVEHGSFDLHPVHLPLGPVLRHGEVGWRLVAQVTGNAKPRPPSLVAIPQTPS